MTTKNFNETRASICLDKMSKDESRIWLMVGMKENGAYSFVADDKLTPEKVANELETLAKAIRLKNTMNN